MYHDEFAARESGWRKFGAAVEERLTGVAFEAGGGATLAMAADLLAQPFLPAIYDLAATIPLAVASATILARRVVGDVRGMVKSTPATVASPQPSIFRGPSRRPAGVKAGRVGSRRID